MPKKSTKRKQITKSVSKKGKNAKTSRADTKSLSPPIRRASPPIRRVRPPIVCFLGHVDHGKTSLLDCIRKTHIQRNEAGGITQSIGAYHVNGITFIDTPGHEAFTAMRARGGQTADIAVLVVAVDDGVMPQTIEAIDHIKSADVPMVVALNKIDIEGANIDRVKKQLSEQGVLVEDWGGNVVSVLCSAKTKEGVDGLLEMIGLVAEMEELQASPEEHGQGMLIESIMNRKRGAMATIVVKQGTVCKGQFLLVGDVYGKIKGMWDWRGNIISEVGPGMPAEILGLKEVVRAGERFEVVDTEDEAQERIELCKTIPSQCTRKPVQIDNEVKTGKLIIKADTDGSLEALHHMLGRFSTPAVQIVFVHEGVGNITEADALLAQSTGAYLLGFRVAIDPIAQQIVKQERISMKTYRIIYHLLEDVEKIIAGREREGALERVGLAEVLKVFTLSDGTLIAGCKVKEGIMKIRSDVRVWRDKEISAEGAVSSLRHNKEEVAKIKEGEECGIGIKPEFVFKEKDAIEAVKEYEGKVEL